MNGTNKATVGVVFGIALLFAALSLVLTLMGIMDDGTLSLYLFAPHGGELGFDLADMGQNSYSVNAVPAGIEGVDACDLIGQMIATASEKEHDAKTSLQQRIAWTLAEAAAVPVGQTLSKEEMSTMVDDLLSLKTPAYTPAGKTVFVVISHDELQKRFN